VEGHAYVGTSGWNYDGWKEGFYANVRRKDWLRHCAERFTAIEVNGTFYRLQQKSTFERWRAETPDAFRFAIKGHRYVTQNKKLLDPDDSIVLERDRAVGLGKKLAAVVWQLSTKLRKDTGRLEGFAKALGRWRSVRHAIEFRHDSWYDREVSDCLREHRIAVCLSDAADWPMWEEVTTDMVYVRLHGHEQTYVSSYSGKPLDEWARRTRGWLRRGYDVHVYFDNDSAGAAPFDAMELLDKLRGANA
jgi:uncharacterized protein YecE (DUF72 family)